MPFADLTLCRHQIVLIHRVSRTVLQFMVYALALSLILTWSL